VIAIDAFLKTSETNPLYDGHEAGVILKSASDKPEFREGNFVLDDEIPNIVGGWARVYRKDRSRPFFCAVNMKEYMKLTKEGRPTRFWRAMPATMIRKVALSHALREAFPNLFMGTATSAEYEATEGELPPAFMKGEEPNWRKFWTKVKKELGVDDKKAHELLEVESIKADLFENGKTMEEIFDMIRDAVQRQTVEGEAKVVTEDPHGIDFPYDSDEEKLPALPIPGNLKPLEAWDEITKLNILNYTQLEKLFWNLTGLQPRDMYEKLGVRGRSNMAIPAWDAFLSLKNKFYPIPKNSE